MMFDVDCRTVSGIRAQGVESATSKPAEDCPGRLAPSQQLQRCPAPVQLLTTSLNFAQQSPVMSTTATIAVNLLTHWS